MFKFNFGSAAETVENDADICAPHAPAHILSHNLQVSVRSCPIAYT